MGTRSLTEPVEALYFAPVGITEMAIHDATTAAFLQVEEVPLCCDTTITEGTMAEELTTHTVLSVTGCVRFFKIHYFICGIDELSVVLSA